VKKIIFILIFLSSCEYSDNNIKVGKTINEAKDEKTMTIIELLAIEEYPFFWVGNSNNVQGFKDDQLEKVELKAKKTEDGVTETITVTPKIFFIKDNAIYLSADFSEKTDEEYVTVTKYFEQVKGKKPSEIEVLPVAPEADFFVGSDGRYKIEKNDYNGTAVSDTFQISSGRFNRNLKVSNYFYTDGVAYIDVQEGLPKVRTAGLYIWRDGSSSLSKMKESGRMWKF